MFNLKVFKSLRPVAKRRISFKAQAESDLKDQVRQVMSKGDQGLILMVRN